MKFWLQALFFVLVMLGYLLFPLFLIRQQERILHKGRPMTFLLEPVDPIDAFRGRYLTLSYDWGKVHSPDSLTKGSKAFLCLGTDSLGRAFPKKLLAEKPENCTYISLPGDLIIPDIADTTAWVRPPSSMQRFYLNETIAPLADSIYQQRLRDSNTPQAEQVEAIVRILNGKARVESLHINDMPLADYLRELK